MSLSVRPLLSAFVLLGTLLPAAAQSPHLQSARPQADRIAAHADLHATTRLAGHVPAWATAANDAGPVPADTTLRLAFVLSRSSERQAAFTQLLADQQNPASPSYHHWLTPQQIGTLYGPTQNDLNTLTSWLTAQGLSVKELAPSRTFVTVEAPVSTVANALSTSFHNFTLRDSLTGQSTSHLAVTTDPAIPTALAAIVTSITGLADTPVTPDHHIVVPRPAISGPHPDANSSSGVHLIAPADFAVLYDINPIYQSGINGTGQKIAILGRSRVLQADIDNLAKNTGVATKQPNTIIPPTGIDPGMTANDDQGEATVDVDRVIATSPGAQPDLVISGSVGGMNGVYITASYEVQTLLDPVMNISFSSCEANDPLMITGVNGFWNTLLAQAAVEGISVIVSSGDSGAAQCQTAGQPPTGAQIRSINDICATSYATCVGGTEFADTASPSTYWKSSNDPTTLESAISYIPEGAWNEPVGTGSTPFVVLGTGGGASTILPRPSWQTGAGVPTGNFRDVPDVSFSASLHNGYIVCLAYLGADCVTHNAASVSGTSTAAPAMASIAALLNQKTGGAQGNLNPLLYDLAVRAPNVFHDATPATSGISCNLNTPSMCNNSTPSAGALTGGLSGYALTAGYDQATGLGSLDVAAFLTTSVTAASINVSPASSSLTIQRGNSPTDLLTISSFAYAGSASLGCTVTFNGSGSAASLPICSIVPGNVTLSGGGSATSTLTLATSTPAPAIAVLTPTSHPAIPAVPGAPFGRIAMGSLFLLVLLPARRYRRSLRAWHSLPTLLLLLTGLGALSACSGSSTPSSPNPLLVSPSSIGLTASAPSIFAGSTDTFSVTVANIGFNNLVAPTGTVHFFENGSPIGTAVTLSNGTATSASITFNDTGTLLITASYSGDSNFSASNATGVPITVIPPGTIPGSYTITVNATGSGGLTASTAIAVTVQ